MEEIIKDYMINLDKCKEYRKRYLLIDTGKEIIENFNISLLPNFNDYKDPYVDIHLKFMKLITDLDVVNQNIIETHEIWNKIVDIENVKLQIYNTYKFKRLRKLHEYIIYDLKHFIDEVIATIAIIKGTVKDNKVFISSIGAYLSKKYDFNDFDNFLDLFQKLDDLSNSYKHSYANSDFLVIGKYENCFVSLYSKYNDFGVAPIPYLVSMDYIIEEFNKFYKFSFKLIDNLTKKEYN